ncbi:MAG: hypothetical protein Q8N91_07260, partial [Candidatus Omnitrophota bacterium]|nr:hypothetical protein [Candidatus Omnitrophota bacterium]
KLLRRLSLLTRIAIVEKRLLRPAFGGTRNDGWFLSWLSYYEILQIGATATKPLPRRCNWQSLIFLGLSKHATTKN